MFRNALPKMKLIVLLLILLSSGCATVESREKASYRQRPHVYPATRYYLAGHRPGAPYEDETLSGWRIYPSPRSLVFSLVAVPYMYVVDFPLSLVLDTTLLPMDLYRCYDYRRSSRFFVHFLQEDTVMPSLKRIAARYVPDYCDVIIRAYVSETNAPVSRAKIAAMVQAGAGLPLIARSSHLDAAIGAQLVLKAAMSEEVYVVVPVLAGNPHTPSATLTLLSDADKAIETLDSEGLTEDAARHLRIAMRHGAQNLARNPGTPPSALRTLAEDDLAIAFEVLENPATDTETINRAGLRVAESNPLICQMHPTKLRPVLEKVTSYATIAAFAENRAYARTVARELAEHPLSDGAIRRSLVERGDQGTLEAVINVPDVSSATLQDVLDRCDSELANPSSHPKARQLWQSVRTLAEKALDSRVDNSRVRPHACRAT